MSLDGMRFRIKDTGLEVVTAIAVSSLCFYKSANWMVVVYLYVLCLLYIKQLLYLEQ
jgi:hypothetical protein